MSKFNGWAICISLDSVRPSVKKRNLKPCYSYFLQPPFRAKQSLRRARNINVVSTLSEGRKFPRLARVFGSMPECIYMYVIKEKGILILFLSLSVTRFSPGYFSPLLHGRQKNVVSIYFFESFFLPSSAVSCSLYNIPLQVMSLYALSRYEASSSCDAMRCDAMGASCGRQTVAFVGYPLSSLLIKLRQLDVSVLAYSSISLARSTRRNLISNVLYYYYYCYT